VFDAPDTLGKLEVVVEVRSPGRVAPVEAAVAIQGGPHKHAWEWTLQEAPNESPRIGVETYHKYRDRQRLGCTLVSIRFGRWCDQNPRAPCDTFWVRLDRVQLLEVAVNRFANGVGKYEVLYRAPAVTDCFRDRVREN
jgi:hypothetical protein